MSEVEVTETVEQKKHQYEADCASCNRHFYLNDKDYAFYVEQGYAMPRRCYTCRKRRKADKEKATE